MAIAFDAVSESSEISGTDSLTWSHSCSGAQRALIVVITTRHVTAGPGVPTGVTYNGVAMTLEVSRSCAQSFIDFGSGPIVSIWSLANPPTGANNVVASFSENISVSGTGAAMSFTGVDQADPVEATGSDEAVNSGPVLAEAIVTFATNNTWLVDGLYHLDNPPLVPDPSQTARSNRGVNGSGDSVGASTKGPVAPPSGSMSWSSSVSAFWAIAAVALREATGPNVMPIIMQMEH